MLEDLYTNIKSVPNFSAKIIDFLRKNEIHSKFRRIVKRKFPTRRIIVHAPFTIWIGDLIEYTQYGYARANNGFKYILVLIDCFSKKAFVEPVKRKNMTDVANALTKIFSGLQTFPNTLITDEGLEFYNRAVRKVLERFIIHHYSIKTQRKASIVERLIRTLKSRLEKYFYKNKTKRWLDVIQQITSNYNRTFHRSIEMAPNDVTDKNRKNVFSNLFPDISKKVKPKLKIGDIVRIVRKKNIFEKGYKQNWSDQKYRIRGFKSTAGRVWYYIEDLQGNRIPGSFYYYELNLIESG